MISNMVAISWRNAVESFENFLYISGRATSTIRVRREHINYIASISGVDGPADLTEQMLLSILISRKDWSQAYRRALRSSLRAFYQHCVDQELVERNIAEVIPAIKEPPAKPRPVTDELFDALIKSTRPREKLIVRLAAHAGLRRAEIAQVHRDDLVRDDAGWSLIVHGKGGKQRTVPLSASLANSLLDYPVGEFIFPGRVDGHLSVSYVGEVISDLMPPGWTLHKLRHRFATRAYAGTGNLRAVQEALGHSSVATTQRYTAVSARDIRAVSDAAAS